MTADEADSMTQRPPDGALNPPRLNAQGKPRTWWQENCLCTDCPCERGKDTTVRVCDDCALGNHLPSHDLGGEA